MSPVVVISREHAGLDTPSPIVTAQTVRKMCEHIANAQSDPLVLGIARSAAQHPDPISSLYWWVKHAVKFRQDDPMIWELFRERDHYELLISPPVLLRMRRPEGDCDDFTMLLCALLTAAGFETQIVTIECDRTRPNEYSHVYLEVWNDSLQNWMPLDASHGKFPGWEVPARDIQRKTSWSMDGFVADDRRVA